MRDISWGGRGGGGGGRENREKESEKSIERKRDWLRTAWTTAKLVLAVCGELLWRCKLYGIRTYI